MSDLCRGCGKTMEVLEPGFFYHPLCIPPFTAVPGMNGMNMYEMELREDLLEVIQWTQRNSKRSQQVALGCSEVGHDCDRRVAYTMAGIQGPNVHTDQWPAIVGTAVHEWMQRAFEEFQHYHGVSEWLTELEIHPSQLVMGHSDLYHAPRGLVLDWKFPGPDGMRKMKQDGPSAQYMTQVQLYGLGNVLAGRKVERVGIVAVGRSGWLKDIFIHTVEFDRAAAEKALQRVYDLGHRLITDAVLEHPQLWSTIPASPSRLCMWCPFYDRSLRSASDKGCPGTKTAEK